MYRQYIVDIDDEESLQLVADIYNDENATPEEITLAGDSPFVVTYDTSNTPFDPIRFSRASINVVADEKFLDVFSSDVHGTLVVLQEYVQDSGSWSFVWTGYLTPNLLNMPEDS